MGRIARLRRHRWLESHDRVWCRGYGAASTYGGAALNARIRAGMHDHRFSGSSGRVPAILRSRLPRVHDLQASGPGLLCLPLLGASLQDGMASAIPIFALGRTIREANLMAKKQ